MVARDRESISPDPGSPDPGKPGVHTGRLAVILLCLAAPHTLLAASSLGSGCDSIARELRSVEIPLEILATDLTIDSVDHMAEDHGAMDPVVGHEHDPTAPLLFLTPRVAHILEDVFGEAAAPRADATPMERVRRIMLAANAAAAKAQSLQSSTEATAAGGDADGDAGTELHESNVSSGPLTQTFYDVDTLPRFQRRMYRNDI